MEAFPEFNHCRPNLVTGWRRRHGSWLSQTCHLCENCGRACSISKKGSEGPFSRNAILHESKRKAPRTHRLCKPRPHPVILVAVCLHAGQATQGCRAGQQRPVPRVSFNAVAGPAAQVATGISTHPRRWARTCSRTTLLTDEGPSDGDGQRSQEKVLRGHQDFQGAHLGVLRMRHHDRMATQTIRWPTLSREEAPCAQSYAKELASPSAGSRRPNSSRFWCAGWHAQQRPYSHQTHKGRPYSCSYIVLTLCVADEALLGSI